MIRGTQQAFKFTTSFDFSDISNIEVVFYQPHNSGTTFAPMPITKYYRKEGTTVVRNDGFTVVTGDSKSFVTALSAEETMRFNDRYKGCVQATVYCDTVGRQEKNPIEYFAVYPTLSDEIFGDIPSSSTDATYTLDAGEIIKE